MTNKKSTREAKWKKLLAKRERFYERHHLARAEDVSAVQAAVEKAVKKNGTKVYRKDRDRCDRFLFKLFEKYNLVGTSSEHFWRVTLLCVLIGPSVEVRRIVKQKEAAPSRKPKWKKRKHRRW